MWQIPQCTQSKLSINLYPAILCSLQKGMICKQSCWIDNILYLTNYVASMEGWFVNILKRMWKECCMKFSVFWDIVPCSLRVDRRFRGVYCLHHQGDEWSSSLMEEVHTSETSVYSNETIQRYIPEDSKLHTRHCENLKSHGSVAASDYSD
jgi:hypothetical protein